METDQAAVPVTDNQRSFDLLTGFRVAGIAAYALALVGAVALILTDNPQGMSYVILSLMVIGLIGPLTILIRRGADHRVLLAYGALMMLMGLIVSTGTLVSHASAAASLYSLVLVILLAVILPSGMLVVLWLRHVAAR